MTFRLLDSRVASRYEGAVVAPRPRRPFRPKAATGPAVRRFPGSSPRGTLRRRASLLLILPFAARAAADSAPLPKAEDVVRKVIERAKNPEVRRARARFIYAQRSVIEKLDEKGQVREREEREYDLAPLEGRSYPSLVKKNGKPLAGEDLKDEQERRRRFLERRTGRSLGRSDEDRVPLDAELFERYRGQVVGREMVGNRMALVLEFFPRSRDLPVRRRQDYVLNKLAGKVWVDEQDYEIVKVEAQLMERARIFWGLVASIEKANIDFEQTHVVEGVYLPLRLNFYIDGRKLFSSLREKIHAEWSGFQPAPEAGTPAKTATKP